MTSPQLHVLDNGFRVLLEPMEHVQSVALGIWLACGSRHEAASENGMTHFCEHLLFKGTSRRTWQELARTMNLLGGNMNACTSTDWVKLYATVVHKDLEEATELLAEMFLDSTFPAEEVSRERDVILEEIAQYDDVPEDLCYERFTQALLLPHPVGRPVIGTTELVSGFTRDALQGYWHRELDPSRLIYCAVGRMDVDAVLRQCEAIFGRIPTRSESVPQLGLEPAGGSPVVKLVDRKLEQVSFCFGTSGPKKRQETRFAWAIYDTILGGGMGSRLFDEVRERRGLAYSIGSSISAMHEAGFLMISGSSRPEAAAQAVDICRQEIAKLAEGGATASEISTAKRQLERSLLLSDESVNVRAGSNGEREIYHVPHMPLEETIDRLLGVTAEDVQAIAREVAGFGPPAACAVGPLKKAKGLEKALA